jgi:hypothetical protein
MRRLLPNGVAGIVVVILLVLAAAGTAVAYFTTTGAGDSAPKGVSQLAKPTLTAAAQVGGTVLLSWGAVTAPGPGTVTYSVTRDGSGAGGGCTPTLIVTTCTDIGLEPGTYTYVVTAKWRSWTTTSSSKAATITVGPADHFVLGAASSTPTAGAADNLTVTAKDAKGGTVTTYAGSHSLTFSGASASPNGTAPTVADSSGSATAFGTATAINFVNGVAAVSSSKNGVMKLYSKGEADIEVSDGSISNVTPLEVTVAAATAAKFALTAADATPMAGEADNLTITALDAYGNLATSYIGSHNLTFSGASVIGTFKPTVSNSSGAAIAFGTATALTFTAGVATVTAGKNGTMTLVKAESPNITVSESTVTSLAPLQVTAAPAAAANFALAAAATSTAGETDNLTVTAQDTYGNVATSYTGSHNLTFSGASASPGGTEPTVSDSTGADIDFGDPTAIAFSAGVSAVTAGKNGAMVLYKSGSTSLKASEGTLLTPTALGVTVAAATAAKFTLAASVTNPVAAGSSNLTITAQDAYGNTATAYASSHNLTFSGASVIGTNKPTVSNSAGTATAFGTATAIGFTAGVATVTSTKNGVMRIYAAGEAGIEVSDGSISTSTPLDVTVSPLVATKLVLSAATTPITAGSADNLTTTAFDTYGNIATAYTGSHNLTFSGASASPNGTVPTVSNSAGTDVAFATATPINFDEGMASVSGGKNGVMKLYKIGATSIKATDGTLTTATISVTVTVAAASKFLLAAATTTPVAGANDSLTITAQDPYGTTATTYAGSHNLTFSGSSASPSGTLPTVADSSGTVINFGDTTAITFTSGIATVVSTTKNGAMKLSRAGAASITVSEGSISNPTPLAVTASPGAAARWALTNINISAGSLGSTCLFTCTLTGLGNSGTVTAKVAVTDANGNTATAVGTGHAAKITTSGSGTISGTPLAIPSTGAAESATTFTFTSKSAGTFNETVTVAFSTGTAYTQATLTASR